jgi:hypothetical protein
VNRPLVIRRERRTKVVTLEQRNRRTGRCGFTGREQPVDAAANDGQVVCPRRHGARGASHGACIVPQVATRCAMA